jgi:multidrug efflux pump subunit AcrA (membrane-fusion protein)
VPGEQGILTIHHQDKGLLVPQSAVTSYTVGEGVVYVFDGGTVRAQMIRYTGNLDNDVHVLSGLSAGQEVVVSDTSQLKTGMQVAGNLVTSDTLTPDAF